MTVEQVAARVEGDLDGELKAARRRGEQFGKQHAAAVEIEAARGLGHHVGRQHAHRDSVHILEVSAEAAEHVRRIHFCFGPEGFRARLDLREVVGFGLQVITNLLHRKHRSAGPDWRVPACHLLGQDLGILAQFPIRLVQSKHGLGSGGTGFRDGPDVRLPYRALSEQRVAENLPEGCIEPRIVVLGKFLEIDIECLAETEQELKPSPGADCVR